MMSSQRMLKSLQTMLAHTLLFSFTLLLVLKLSHSVLCPWWIIFSPLWLFHAVVARGRFSLPAPSIPYDRNWAPFHAVMATPLLVSFELLICIYFEAHHVVSLKIVFLPLLAFQAAILVDNIRMCRALMPGDDENMTDEAIWETLPHFWVAISMVFFIAATTFTLLKLCGDVEALGWWDLLINYGVAEFFAFLTCTKWYNPVIHRNNANRATNSSSTLSYNNWTSGLLSSLDEETQQSGICNLEDIGGHLMKIPLICFQILLVMRLEGTPVGARNIPIPVLFFPLFLLQGAALLFSIYRFLEKIVLFLGRDSGSGMHFGVSPMILDCMGFMRHGSRLLGWWSIDEGSQEERARLYYPQTSGYNTFSPDSVKKMPKAELTQEIWRLHAALSEQTEISKFSQEEFERLQHEKILCRICFDEQINIVLLPCRHYILCSICSERCKRCPICRVYVEDRLPIYDV